MKQGKQIQNLQSGDTIVFHGVDDYHRYLLKYTNPEELVTQLRERDDPNGKFRNNQDYMRTINDIIASATETTTVPLHSEEAFVNALFRIGLFSKANLH